MLPTFSPAASRRNMSDLTPKLGDNSEVDSKITLWQPTFTTHVANYYLTLCTPEQLATNATYASYYYGK